MSVRLLPTDDVRTRHCEHCGEEFMLLLGMQGSARIDPLPGEGDEYLYLVETRDAAAGVRDAPRIRTTEYRLLGHMEAVAARREGRLTYRMHVCAHKPETFPRSMVTPWNA
jgi:hypothetical protein